MKRLFLIRHGETDGSVQLRYYGHTDIPLNQKGIQQANQLAERLANEPIDTIYSSDLARSYEMARIIAGSHGLKVRKSKNLREIDLGDWEGLTFDEMKAKDNDLVDKWMIEFSTFRMPNGESIPEFRARVEEVIKDIIAKDMGSTVVIVTHGGVTRMILCHLLDWDLSSFWGMRQDTGCLNIIEFDRGRPNLALLNSREIKQIRSR